LDPADVVQAPVPKTAVWEGASGKAGWLTYSLESVGEEIEIAHRSDEFSWYVEATV
jgi:hypothetical protein